MTFDALTLAAVAAELRHNVIGGRVQRVLQPDELTIALEVYAQHQRRWLLLTADPQQPRMHFTNQRPGAGEAHSPLLLLLRKYVRGRRLLTVEQPPFERSLTLRFGFPDHAEPDDLDEDHGQPITAPADTLSSAREVAMIIEVIGRYSNVILVDADGTVMDAIKRIPQDMNRYRVVLPHRPYAPPPPQTKLRPDIATVADVADAFERASTNQTAWQALVGAFAGVSPLLAREAVYRAHGAVGIPAHEADPAIVAVELIRLWRLPQEGNWEPGVAANDDGVIVAFAPYRLTHLPRWRPAESMSHAADTFYGSSGLGKVQQARRLVLEEVEKQIGLQQRKLESLERAFAQGEAMDRWRRYGEAILANLASLRRGQAELVVGGETIALDPSRSGSENAQRYFQRYRKAKAALVEVPRLIEETALRKRFLEELRGLVLVADNVEAIRELRRDLAQREGKPTRKRPSRGRATGPLRFRTPTGEEVLVGRSGRENDQATFDLAGPADIWLHARGVPGAHVILRSDGRTPGLDALRYAAELAAYFSASRTEKSVAVDWTERRNVRRLGKGVPGLVSYRGERVLSVEPTYHGRDAP